MNKKTFFANVASKALALAAVVMMMSAAFTSCSKDSDDDNGGLPEPKAQTVTLDGAEKPILKAEYEDRGNGNYLLFLYLSADSKEKIELNLNKDLHITGSPIDLTKKEKEHDGYYWVVGYYKPDDTTLIVTFGNPNDPTYPIFTTGTLTMSGSFENINIRLENGRVIGKDGKEHTLTISYSGPMTEI